MRPRLIIGISAAIWTGIALLADDMTAVFVSLGCHGLAFQLHRLEVKLNRLLDERKILVTDDDVRRG